MAVKKAAAEVPADAAAAIADLETELKTATGDRVMAIEASIRSLKNPGMTTDAEARGEDPDAPPPAG